MVLNQPEVSPSYTPQQLLTLLATQIKSYQKAYKLGKNTSVSSETAQELLRSIQYTLSLSPMDGSNPMFALERGQGVLEQAHIASQQLLDLVIATEQSNDTWRWRTLRNLKGFLDRYDRLHFAHKIPLFLDYPIASSFPESCVGLHWIERYLQCLWMENRIYDTIQEAVFCKPLPPDWGIAPENILELPLLRRLEQHFDGLWEEKALLEDAE